MKPRGARPMSEFKFGLFRVSLVSSFYVYDSPRATRRQVSQLGARGRQWCDWKFFSIEHAAAAAAAR